MFHSASSVARSICSFSLAVILLTAGAMLIAPPAGAQPRTLQELMDGDEIVVSTLMGDVVFDQFTVTVDPSSQEIDSSNILVRAFGNMSNRPGLRFLPQEDSLSVAGGSSILFFVRYRLRTRNGSDLIAQAQLASAYGYGPAVGSNSGRLQLDVTEELTVVSGKSINRINEDFEFAGFDFPSILTKGEKDSTGKFDPVAALQVETRVSLSIPRGHGGLIHVTERFVLGSGMEPDCPPTDGFLDDAPVPLRTCLLTGRQFLHPFLNLPINQGGDTSGLLTSAPPLTEQTDIFWSGYAPRDDLATVGTVSFVTNPSPNFSLGDGGVSGADSNGEGLLSYEQSVFDENFIPVGLDMVVQNLDTSDSANFLGLSQSIDFEGVEYEVDRLFGQLIAGDTASVNAELVASGSSLSRPAILIADLGQIFVDGSVPVLDIIFAGDELQTAEGPVILADRGIEVVAVDNETRGFVLADIGLDAEFREVERLFFVPGDGGPARRLAGTGDDVGSGTVIRSLLVSGTSTAVNANGAVAVTALTGPAGGIEVTGSAALVFTTSGARHLVTNDGAAVPGLAGAVVTSVGTISLTDSGSGAVQVQYTGGDGSSQQALLRFTFDEDGVTLKTPVTTEDVMTGADGNPVRFTSFLLDSRGGGETGVAAVVGVNGLTGVPALLAFFPLAAAGPAPPNNPPVADAGADAVTVDATGPDGAAVALDGSNSFDPDGDEITYRWVDALTGQVLGTTAVLEVTLPVGTHTVVLTVNDGSLDSIPDLVPVFVRGPNRAPIADAGPDSITIEASRPGGAFVVLSGSNSSDPDDDEITYTWTDALTDEELGTDSLLVLDLPLGTHTIALIVNDGSLDSLPDFVTVTVQDLNQNPIAVAEPESTTVNEDGSGFATVLLDGSRSSDPDGDELTYRWYDTGTFETLGRGSSLVVTLPVGVNLIGLEVSDGVPGQSGFDIVTVTVLDVNDPPVADAGPDSVIVEATGPGGATVGLDGRNSTDSDGDALTYEWSNSIGEVVGNTATIDVLVPLGFHSFGLTVSDGTESSSDVIVVEVKDTTPPTITAPPDVTAECTGFDESPVELGTPDVFDAVGVESVFNDAPANGRFNRGLTVVTWTATDAAGNQATADQFVVVADTIAPSFDSFTIDPSILWPPNHKLRRITPAVDVSDACDPFPQIDLSDITMNEGDEDDIQIDLGTGQIFLRAERSGGGAGRVYTLRFTVTDDAGNSSEASGNVIVPHNR